MTPVSRSLILMAAAAASFGAPTGAAAQTATFASLGGAEPRSVAAAEQLEERAHHLSLGSDWSSAAPLFRSAADLRGTADRTAADNLRFAGYISFYEGRPDRAMSELEIAGDVYLSLGDVVGAASTLTEAAWVAAHDDRMVEAKALRDRALLLTRSPLLDATERDTLIRRLGT